MNLSVKENNDINNILVINLKLLKLLGLWQGNVSALKFSLAMKLFIIYRWALLIILYLHTVAEYLDIIFTWGDLENLAANGSVALIYTACIMKQTIFLLYEKRLQDLVQGLRSGYLATSLRWTEDHYNILQNADRRAQSASWRYYYLCIGTIFSFFVRAILFSYGAAVGLDMFNQGNQTVKTLVFKAWFPFDIQQPGNYEIAFCFQMISCTMGPAVNAAMDTLLVSVIINCCGEFKVLKYSLRTIRERGEELLALEKLHKVEKFSASEVLEREGSGRDQPGCSTGEPYI